ncbi:MAG TPA: hypothetical protein VIZ69_09775, partial [Thermoanaerobaculia bacterium]
VAVVFLFLIARRVVNARVALIAGFLYAFWVSSIAWSGYSVLRDSLVWALILACTYLALKVVDGSAGAAVILFPTLLLLRSVRPYAATFLVIGFGVAGLFALVRRSRRALRPALVLGTIALASEVVFFTAGFPSGIGMLVAYQPRRVLLKPVVQKRGGALPAYRGGREPTDADAEDRPDVPVKRLFGPSLPANTLRFFLNPPAWAPVAGDIRHSDNWQLPGMWPWYGILPVAAYGLFLSRKGSRALRTIVLTSVLFGAMLILVGRGDSARQREMIVPIVLLCFAVGIGPALRQPRRLLIVYLVYALLLIAGIAYHRATLRARGLAGLAPPQEREQVVESNSRGQVYESTDCIFIDLTPAIS